MARIQNNQPPPSTQTSGRNLPVIHIDDEIIVVGRVQKPEIFLVLGRTDFTYRGLFSTPDSFVDKILKSIEKNHF